MSAATAAPTASVVPSSSTTPPVHLAWLISRRADFWLATGGASIALLVVALVLLTRGNRALDTMDFLFAELHLGATYDAIVRRKLHRRMPYEILLVPAYIVALTFALTLTDQHLYLHTAFLYLAVWHRGRQNYGVARYYQRKAGGAVSPTHDRLFHAAIYLPMIAAVLFYTSAYPDAYEGEHYQPLILPFESIRPWIDRWAGLLALGSVIGYGWYTHRRNVHPAERWTVLAHAVAFGTAYFLGAWRASFIIVIAIHHEIQYLFFAYAIAHKQSLPGARTGWRKAAAFAVFPLAALVLGFGIDHCPIPWLLPTGEALLLCHYWWDGVIWKGEAMRPVSSS
jgi:hypothetical protein